jgi:signal transduction histidine kinase
VAVGVTACAGGLGGALVSGPLVTLPAAGAVLSALHVLTGWPSSIPTRRTGAIGAAALISLTATGGVLLLGDGSGGHLNGWALAELAALLVLVAVGVRGSRSPFAWVAVGLAGLAVTTWLFRFVSPFVDPRLALPASTAYALLAVIAAAVGLYQRHLDAERVRSVGEARRVQRLEFARDLHDFVAHDVSEMVALAQAGQVLAERDPTRTEVTFRRIEQAGQAALASMDRTVHMLHDASRLACPAAASSRSREEHEGRDGLAADRTPVPGLAELPALADRFAASGAARVELRCDPSLARQVPREVGAAAYRVVVEALTNVRRHAPTATRVEVSVRRARGSAGHTLEVAVSDDAAPSTLPRRPSTRRGLGLPGLVERVEALGGDLVAGPREPTGWSLAAVLPLAPAPHPTYGKG